LRNAFKVELDVIEWNTLFTNWRKDAKDETARGAHATNLTYAAMAPVLRSDQPESVSPSRSAP
jgi:hypothetical protein